MNERIRELIQEQNGNRGLLWTEEDKEEFAELIVQECAGACLHDDWEDPRWGRFYANKIREHFAIR